MRFLSAATRFGSLQASRTRLAARPLVALSGVRDFSKHIPQDGGFRRIFHAEPVKPTIVTEEVPGPVSIANISALNQIWDTSSCILSCDYGKSVGNYLADADGNMLLDCFGQISSMAAGYNNPYILNILSSNFSAEVLDNRPALGVAPPMWFFDLVNESLMPVAPEGLTNVFTATTGSEANENAMKMACIVKANKLREEGPFTELEISSAMNNQAPGCPNMAILSFEKGFHGRTFGALAVTHSKPVHKIGIPSFDWPVVPFPQLRYPLENFVKENAAEEERCLNAVKEVFKTWKAPIAACIVEPIQAEGGDRYASADFFRQLQMIVAENDAQFIVDEVQTGVCATGTYWAHEQWDLPHSPDYVIFSKKMQAAGFFYRDESRPDMPYRIYNTWLGDPSRIVLAGVINSWIANNDVQARVNHVGKTLIDGLHSLHELFPDIVTNVRGQGTFCAFDLPDRDTQQQFLAITRKLGLFVGACGETTIRFRPMLVFGDKHCNIAIDILGSACASLKMNN